MHVNKTKFERNSSPEYYHMTCIRKTTHKLKRSIPSEARYINLSRVNRTARQRLKLSCEYFYWSLGCPQLTSSSCDVRVHFRVARQRCVKCECKHSPQKQPSPLAPCAGDVSSSRNVPSGEKLGAQVAQAQCESLNNGPDKNDSNNGNEHVGMQENC